MGSLSSELRTLTKDPAAAPRVYVDANLPYGAVTFMRHDLKWDVLFVLERADLRRAPDREHFDRALDLGRTLITLDHDFADARRFPQICSPGVVILTAPDEAALKRLLVKVDVRLREAPDVELPLKGRRSRLRSGTDGGVDRPVGTPAAANASAARGTCCTRRNDCRLTDSCTTGSVPSARPVRCPAG